MDSINNKNSNLINNPKQDDLLLKQFIEKFNDTDWAWKIKAITDYNINENTLNFGSKYTIKKCKIIRN